MKEFKLAPFGDLSAAAIEAHLGLYKGYVEQTETVLKYLRSAPVPKPADAALTPRETLSRRLSFERNGARLHELGTPAEGAILYVVDLWEHAYWSDYGAKGRERYLRDLLGHSNWQVPGNRYRQSHPRNT